MKTIAALFTCYNRKQKTLNALESLKQVSLPEDHVLDIYLVDGGSSDGTVESVKQHFPDVKVWIKQGVYWAGGMREAWQVAANSQHYDYFLLLNDDVCFHNDMLLSMFSDEEGLFKTFKTKVVLVGSTIDPETNNISYGGRKLTKKGRSKSRLLTPDNDFPQECELGNANIMLVPSEIYKGVGMLSNHYTHGIADYDYTLRVIESGFKVYVCSRVCGECADDHGKNWLSADHSLKQRIAYLYSPKGLAYKEYLYYIKRFFPEEYAPTVLKLWLKTLFPFIWDKFKN